MKKLELADSVVLPPAAQEDRKRRKNVINSFNVSFIIVMLTVFSI